MSTNNEELRAGFDLPPADISGGDPSAIFEYAATVADLLQLAGWHGGMLGGGEVEWLPCDPRHPDEIHPACRRIVDRRKLRRGQTIVRATLRLENAGAVELRIGHDVERHTNLFGLFERVMGLVRNGYGKIQKPGDVHRLALRIAARQAGQPTDNLHLDLFEQLIAAREALDLLRASRSRRVG